MTNVNTLPERIKTGIAGLDHILRGGLPEDMVYLIHGGPGTGKTTLGFQFLLEGVRHGERVLYASLLQPRKELETVLASHNWSLDGIDLLEIPAEVKHSLIEEQTLFNTDEIELPALTDIITGAIDKYKPSRLVFDSITELAVLMDSSYQLRRQLLKLKEFLSARNCTTFFTVNDTEAVDLTSLRTVVHGIIELGINRLQFSRPQRWLETTKMRGMRFMEGRHDFQIQRGGLEIFPRIEITPKKKTRRVGNGFQRQRQTRFHVRRRARGRHRLSNHRHHRRRQKHLGDDICQGRCQERR